VRFKRTVHLSPTLLKDAGTASKGLELFSGVSKIAELGLLGYPNGMSSVRQKNRAMAAGVPFWPLLKQSGSMSGSYTIAAGDTLTSIANQYGVTLSALEQMNPQITNPDYIQAGDSLTVPDQAVSSAPATAAALASQPAVIGGVPSWVYYGGAVAAVIAGGMVLSQKRMKSGKYAARSRRKRR
jgi:LysM repeat protein